MINALMHVFAWGLVCVLVWSSWFAVSKPVPEQFQALAELEGGVYLAVVGNNARFSLIKYEAGQLGRRAVQVDDWELDFAGRVIGICAVKGYAGEVLAAVEKPDGISVVHLQIRNWLKTPKSAILGRAMLPQSAALESFSALSCGEANQELVSLLLYGSQGRGISLSLSFDGMKLTRVEEQDVRQNVLAAFENEQGYWESVRNGEALGSVIWFTPKAGEASKAFTLDGFWVTGIARGPEGNDISVVTAEPGLGSVWRPLRLPKEQP